MFEFYKMNFIFRCDGNYEIGMGHVMRCISLGKVMKKQGCNIVWVMQNYPDVVQIVSSAGFQVSTIDCLKDEKHGGLDLYDTQLTLDIAKNEGANVVIVDHYEATTDYLEKVRHSGIKLAVIGLGRDHDRDLTAAHWFLNQNLGASKLCYKIRSDCVSLLGPTYALLREQFLFSRTEITNSFDKTDRRVLITLGGSDMTDQYLMILRAISMVQRNLDVRFIVGGGGNVKNLISQARSKLAHNIQIYDNVSDMAEHMIWADVSINAGGSTCWELCCLGVPMIILIASDDQVLTAQELDNKGYAKSVGNLCASSIDADLAEALEELLYDPQQRAKMSSRSQDLVDGFGANRVSKSLISLCDS